MLYRIAHVLLVAVSIFAAASRGRSADDRPALQLTVSKAADARTKATATAIRVKQDESGTIATYVVGAYHTLVGGRDPIAKAQVRTPTGRSTLVEIHLDPRFLQVRDLYYNIVQDIFIARVEPEFLRAANIPSAELGDAMPAGQSVSAVGNPKVEVRDVVYDADNISYGCTIAEYGEARNRVARLLEDPAGVADREVLFTEAQLLHRMFIETLSVKLGFSGGPILCPSSDGTGAYKVLGVVVAGTQDVAPGRFAIACPAAELKRMIAEYESLHLDIRANRTPSAQKYRGIWRKNEFDSIDWTDPQAMLKYGSPYRGSQFSAVDELTIDHQTITGTEFVTASRYDEAARTRKSYYDILTIPTRSRIIFNNCVFIDVDFRDSLLSYVEFRNCKFYGDKTSFRDASVSGCSFQNCGFPFRPRSACYFLFGYNSIGDINNYQNTQAGFDPKGVADPFAVTDASPTGGDTPPADPSVPRRMPPPDGPGKVVAASSQPAAPSELPLDFVACQRSTEEWVIRRDKLLKYRGKLDKYIRQPDSNTNNRFIKVTPDSARARYALTYAEVTLEIAECQLRVSGENPTVGNLNDADRSLTEANDLLGALDPARFDVDEQRVYFSISSLHRKLVVIWLRDLTRITVAGSPSAINPNLQSCFPCPPASGVSIGLAYQGQQSFNQGRMGSEGCSPAQAYTSPALRFRRVFGHH